MDVPRKRAKIGENSHGTTFANATDIKSCFHNLKQNANGAQQGLTRLRSQLAIKYEEGPISPQDVRLLLVQHWLENDHSAQNLFDAWAPLNNRSASTISVLVSIVTSTLTLLTAHYTHHSLGLDILRVLLSPSWMRRLNSYLAGGNAELTLVTLKLFNTMASFASGRERKAVVERFAWESKALPKLLNMRRKTKEGVDTLVRPDIRTSYMLFVLSIVDFNVENSVKSLFLEQRGAIFMSIFKNLHEDSYPVVKKVLEVCWAGIWSDPKLKRTTKIALFSEKTIAHIVKLYERSEPEDGLVAADLVHHFLLAICTHPGIGICFKDNGWYPREDQSSGGQGSKIFNKILANVVKSLKVNEDSRQQELALRILGACSELVAGYWSAASLTLEPRLSSKWLANNAVFSDIISLPIPVSTFFLSGSTQYKPSPPPLHHITENVIPAVSMKAHFTKGLQLTSSPLVQHCTAIALSKCLIKFRAVVNTLQTASEQLEESEEDGQWTTRRRELENELGRRCPDFGVIVAFAQQTSHGEGGSSAEGATRTALLSEAAHRLLSLYHECLPLAVAGVKFDVGKLLTNFTVEGQGEQGVKGLDTLKRLHILRLLKESDQFSWGGKAGSSSSLSILLHAYTSTTSSATRHALTLLLQHILSKSILFESAPEEPRLWLEALPTLIRSPDSRASDGAQLTDERDSVIIFLDDCSQRCLKNPYRYIEDLSSFLQSTLQTSSLLMVVLEQLNVKVTNKLVSASDTLALVTFIRRLLYALSSHHQTLTFLQRVAERVDEILSPARLFEDYPVVSAAVRKEVELMKVYLYLDQLNDPAPLQGSAPAVSLFLDKAEQVVQPDSQEEQKTIANELVDWYRLINLPLSQGDVNRIWTLVERFHGPTLRELVPFINPALHSAEVSASLAANIGFLYLFAFHSPPRGLDILLSSFDTDFSITTVQRALVLVAHRCFTNDPATPSLPNLRGGLAIVQGIIEKAKIGLSKPSFQQVKEFVLLRLYALRQLLLSDHLQDVCLDIRSLLSILLEMPGDKDLILEFTVFWANRVFNSPAMAREWLPYFTTTQVLDLVDTIDDGHILEAALSIIKESPSDYEGHLISRLNRLLALRTQLNPFIIDPVIAIAINSSLPVGLYLSPTPQEGSLCNLVQRAQCCWANRTLTIDSSIDVGPFLEQEEWTSSTVDIIAGLLLRTKALPGDWIPKASFRSRQIEHSATVLSVIADHFEPSDLGIGSEASLRPVLVKLVDTTIRGSPAFLRERCAYAVKALAVLTPGLQLSLQEIALKALKKTPPDVLTVESFYLGHALRDRVSNELVDLGLQWAARNLSPTGSNRDDGCMVKSIIKLLESITPAAAQVENFVTVCLQQYLFNPSALELASKVVAISQLKPLVVNRFIQTIVQHPLFLKIGSVSSPCRDPVCTLLHALFHLHPWNTCQPSQVQPLISIYQGTLSSSDRKLLSIFKLFEIHRKTSIVGLLERWSTSHSSSSNSLQAIQSLDPIQTLRTSLSYPRWRKLEEQTEQHCENIDAQLYDPVFILLLFSIMLSNHVPDSAFSWIEMFRTNVVGLVIRSLSSKDQRIREVAMVQITGLWQCIENANLQEKPQVQYILGLLKNLFSATPDSPPHRLPSLTTVLLVHALRGIFYPSNFVHPLTARFLLQRPALDISDVPLLYGMLYSSGDTWKKDRAWIVRFLADGMMSSEDWRVLKRRHTWDILASLFTSSHNDLTLRRGILEVLSNLTCNIRAVSSLVLRSGLLPWIEMQLLDGILDEEALFWIRILVNIVTIGEADKYEAATSGEWKNTICRILIAVSSSQAATTVFLAVTELVLRLVNLPGPIPTALGGLMKGVITTLSTVERDINPDSLNSSENITLPNPPYNANTIRGAPAKVTDLDAWASSVKNLWRISMEMDDHELWEALTPRILMLRSLQSGNVGEEGEWVFRETLKNIA